METRKRAKDPLLGRPKFKKTVVVLGVVAFAAAAVWLGSRFAVNRIAGALVKTIDEAAFGLSQPEAPAVKPEEPANVPDSPVIAASEEPSEPEPAPEVTAVSAVEEDHRGDQEMLVSAEQVQRLLSAVAGRELLSGFGWCHSEVHDDWRFHTGIDIRAAAGETIEALVEGVVAEVGEDPRLGRFVILDHGSGYETVYAALDSVTVKPRDTVLPGAQIGTVGVPGSQDLSLGPCLHFELRKDGVPVDPLAALAGAL